MFGLIENLAKAVVGVVTLPVAAVVDTAEVLDVVRDSGKSNTEEALKSVVNNLQQAAR